MQNDGITVNTLLNEIKAHQENSERLRQYRIGYIKWRRRQAIAEIVDWALSKVGL